jgi:hypothetical protein
MLGHITYNGDRVQQYTFLPSFQAFEAVQLMYLFFRNSAFHHWLFIMQCFKITWWLYLQGMDIQIFTVDLTLED